LRRGGPYRIQDGQVRLRHEAQRLGFGAAADGGRGQRGGAGGEQGAALHVMVSPGDCGACIREAGRMRQTPLVDCDVRFD
jgi:hypothetical protein